MKIYTYTKATMYILVILAAIILFFYFFLRYLIIGFETNLNQILSVYFIVQTLILYFWGLRKMARIQKKYKPPSDDSPPPNLSSEYLDEILEFVRLGNKLGWATNINKSVFLALFLIALVPTFFIGIFYSMLLYWVIPLLLMALAVPILIESEFVASVYPGMVFCSLGNYDKIKDKDLRMAVMHEVIWLIELEVSTFLLKSDWNAFYKRMSLLGGMLILGDATQKQKAKEICEKFEALDWNQYQLVQQVFNLLKEMTKEPFISFAKSIEETFGKLEIQRSGTSIRLRKFLGVVVTYVVPILAFLFPVIRVLLGI